MKKFCLIFSALFISFALYAGMSQLPVVNINGTRYYHYTVARGETVLGISKKLGIKAEELLRCNPDVKTMLREGQSLYFPVVDFSQGSNPVITEYVAKKGDSVYGISRRFGMDQDAFLALNPRAVDGIKIGEVYRVYNNDSEAAFSAGDYQKARRVSAVSKHAIQSGETLYSIAERHGCTVADIARLNPDLDTEHYQIGQEIVLPEKSAVAAGKVYIVKEHDTFYGVAHSHGVSIEQLQQANPGVNILKEGMALVIPDSCDESEPAHSASPEATPAPLPTFAENSGSYKPDAATGIEKQSENLTIAIALPFCMNLKEKPRAAKNSADFYRGFMLGVDSIKSNGREVKIMAFDTENSPSKVAEILKEERLLSADFIIAPETTDALLSFADYGKTNNIKVLNLFNTKDSTYLTNPNFFQANIPYERMVDKAIDYASRNFDADELIVLSPEGLNDKSDVVAQLIKCLEGKAVKVTKIPFSGKLTVETLAKLPLNKRYLFIPTTSKPATATEIVEVLAGFKERLTPGGSISLLGYPDWITLKGKALDHMKAVNTTIYSRFYSGSDDIDIRDVEKKYLRWYGHEIPSTLPRQSLSGFDIAMMLLSSPTLNSNELIDRTFNGSQSLFQFTRQPGGGWVNDGMYILNYRPSGLVDKIIL